ncbi:hypothetical protein CAUPRSCDRAFT_11009 [Caulochytrium protostelioides]|uniref:Uncharacterized protein n=1 Tax=Caulochytrium protostelioides TaxID=1555241 RepID=A0A4P9WX51_9FUNG|nr:hypothetical protein CAUPRSCDRAFT_11009 [Caulochytrium protostelioides]
MFLLNDLPIPSIVQGVTQFAASPNYRRMLHWIRTDVTRCGASTRTGYATVQSELTSEEFSKATKRGLVTVQTISLGSDIALGSSILTKAQRRFSDPIQKCRTLIETLSRALKVTPVSKDPLSAVIISDPDFLLDLKAVSPLELLHFLRQMPSPPKQFGSDVDVTKWQQQLEAAISNAEQREAELIGQANYQDIQDNIWAPVRKLLLNFGNSLRQTAAKYSRVTVISRIPVDPELALKNVLERFVESSNLVFDTKTTPFFSKTFLRRLRLKYSTTPENAEDSTGKNAFELAEHLLQCRMRLRVMNTDQRMENAQHTSVGGKPQEDMVPVATNILRDMLTTYESLPVELPSVSSSPTQSRRSSLTGLTFRRKSHQ